MFWGLILKANRKYTQTIQKSFHLSHAALDVTTASDTPVQVVLTCDKTSYILCTLRKNAVEQVALDLNFEEGEELSFTSQGSGSVHLSGYLVVDDFNPLDDDDDDLDMELQNTKKEKKLKQANDELEEDSDNDEEEMADEEGGDSEDDDSDEDESEDEAEIEEPVAKKPKQNGVSGKPQKNKTKGENVVAEKPKGEKTLAGGVKVEDIRIGQGPEAKSGKKVQVLYEGRLKSNNKMFDSSKTGSGFKFGLGKGEVIKGWDIGVVGMKVGGKRKIICPPHMAYGAKGSPPVIPPNSTLVFEVELKAVN